MRYFYVKNGQFYVQNHDKMSYTLEVALANNIISAEEAEKLKASVETGKYSKEKDPVISIETFNQELKKEADIPAREAIDVAFMKRMEGHPFPDLSKCSFEQLVTKASIWRNGTSKPYDTYYFYRQKQEGSGNLWSDGQRKYLALKQQIEEHAEQLAAAIESKDKDKLLAAIKNGYNDALEICSYAYQFGSDEAQQYETLLIAKLTMTSELVKDAASDKKSDAEDRETAAVLLLSSAANIANGASGGDDTGKQKLKLWTQFEIYEGPFVSLINKNSIQFLPEKELPLHLHRMVKLPDYSLITITVDFCTNGHFEKANAPGHMSRTFTYEDVLEGGMRFVPDGPYHAPSFMLKAHCDNERADAETHFETPWTTATIHFITSSVPDVTVTEAPQTDDQKSKSAAVKAEPNSSVKQQVPMCRFL